MKKKTILHFIYSLGRGGAETMLVRVLKELTEYNNIVVTLQGKNHFENELQCDEYICLNKPSLFSLPLAALELRRFIKSRNIDLVHSHLPLSNFVARLGVPPSIPLITTIHNSIATSGDYKKWFIRFIDKSTYNFRKSKIIAVSNNALNDYFSVLKMKRKDAILLYNFVDTEFYLKTINTGENDDFKAVCVAALSRQKNIAYLIKGFDSLKGELVELHVYGRGELKKELQNQIDLTGVKIVLKGQVDNIHVILPRYDLFVMSSLFEGFSLSVLEAMASGLPLLLSDIPSFREQCREHAVYFDLNNPEDFAKKLRMLKSDATLRTTMAANAQKYVSENFTLAHHITRLKEIYDTYITNR